MIYLIYGEVFGDGFLQIFLGKYAGNQRGNGPEFKEFKDNLRGNLQMQENCGGGNAPE